MKIVFYDNAEIAIAYGDFPPETDWDAHIAHRDKVARAIGWHLRCTSCDAVSEPCDCTAPHERVGGHPSHGFQYGVDISAGNVDCVMVKRVRGKAPIILAPDPETGEYPAGAEPATICRYDSWR